MRTGTARREASCACVVLVANLYLGDVKNFNLHREELSLKPGFKLIKLLAVEQHLKEPKIKLTMFHHWFVIISPFWNESVLLAM